MSRGPGLRRAIEWVMSASSVCLAFGVPLTFPCFAGEHGWKLVSHLAGNDREEAAHQRVFGSRLAHRIEGRIVAEALVPQAAELAALHPRTCVMGGKIADEGAAQDEDQLRFHGLHRRLGAAMADPLQVVAMQIAARHEGMLGKRVGGDVAVGPAKERMTLRAVERLLLLEERR